MPDGALITRPIAEAVAKRSKGVNILIYSPPGTSKTEFSRVVCREAALRLYAVGEIDGDWEEPTRYNRVSALMLAQLILKDKKHAVALFDEMEDFIGNSHRS